MLEFVCWRERERFIVMGIMLPKDYLMKSFIHSETNRKHRTQNLLPNCLINILKS